jgi:predicted PurR-regulated permease PerM
VVRGAAIVGPRWPALRATLTFRRMALLDTRRQRAALLIIVLGVGLAAATTPYATGLVGAPVIVALFAPLNTWLQRRVSSAVAAGLVILAALLVVVLPLTGVAALVVAEAPGITRRLLGSPLLARLETLQIGPFLIGAELRNFGDQIVRWFATGALGFIGTATRSVLNLVIALFGAYFLLLRADGGWGALRPFIPFSDENVEHLRVRFRDVTNSTVIGVLMVAAIQGALLGGMFLVLGLPNPAFWGVVTAILSILPLVGSGLVWVPACAALAFDGRWAAAVVLAIWGLAVVGGADNVIRPVVYRRWANIHPFVTLIGAFAGIRWFGLLGILVGPLALSYFFALIEMYSQEYIEPQQEVRRRTAEMAVLTPPARSPDGTPASGGR